MRPSDIDDVVELLCRGFPDRRRKYWANALGMLQRRERPAGLPELGYVLEADGKVVGVHLLIFARLGDAPVRCNAAALYVEPRYQGHAAGLVSVATKLKTVTYMNTTASSHTWPVLEALGYRRYSQGQFAAIPALSGGGRRARVETLRDCAGHRALPEYDLMRTHAEAGCLALVCETEGGPLPFVLLPRRMAYAPFGVAQLVYCRDTASFVSSARALGRFLLTKGVGCVLLDADGPIEGLAGRFFPNKTPKFFKGPDRPRQNDLAYTEMVLFGP
jgi:GNAT superfamily N-acetyltransferase